MSYPSNQTPEEREELNKRMDVVVLKGTIVKYSSDDRCFKVLRDSTAHGCPDVIELDPVSFVEIGEPFPMTLYLHSNSMSVVGKIEKSPCSRFDLLDF